MLVIGLSPESPTDPPLRIAQIPFLYRRKEIFAVLSKNKKKNPQIITRRR
jgi:hypothetical protein